MAETMRQVLNKIKAFAKKYNETYCSVEHHININSDGTETSHFRAYINGFGMVSIGNTSTEIINDFEQSAQKPDPKSEKTDDDDLYLPF